MILFNDLVHSISTFVWPLLRLSGFALTLPILSSAMTPPKVRLMFVIFIAFLTSKLHPEWPTMFSFSMIGFIGMLKEFMLGLLMGTIIQFVFQAFVLGGQIIAMQAGLGFAMLIDPSSKANVPLVSQFYLMAVTLVFLILDGHLAMIDLIVNSFKYQPLGGNVIDKNALWQLLMFSAWMFKGAVYLALPMIVSLLMVSMSFGIMMKAAPQINIFSVGFPITLLLGVVIMYVTLGSVLPHIESLHSSAFTFLEEMLKNG